MTADLARKRVFDEDAPVGGPAAGRASAVAATRGTFLLNAAVSVFATVYRALSTLIVGKVVVLSFGAAAFAAHAQATLILTAILPVSCGFISLALTSAKANADDQTLRRYFGFGASAACVLSVAALAVMLVGGRAVAVALFGDGTWLPFAALVPTVIITCVLWSMSTAVLVGAGKGRAVVAIDLANATLQLGLVAAAARLHSLRVVVVGMPLIYVLVTGGILVACRGTARAMLQALRVPVRRATCGVRDDLRAVLPYVSTGVFASFIAPAVLLYARAATMHQLGADEAASFVAAQRLAALMSAPVSIYLLSFLSPKFVKGSVRDALGHVRAFTPILVGGYAAAAVVCALLLDFVVALAFSRSIAVPLALYATVCLGELGRVTGSVYAQMYAVRAEWETYVAADLVYVAVFFGTFTGVHAMTRSGLPIAYLAAGLSYVLALAIYSSWRRRADRSPT